MKYQSKGAQLNVGTICAEQINRLHFAENLSEAIEIISDGIDHFFGLRKIDELEKEMAEQNKLSLFKKLKQNRVARKEELKKDVFKFLKKQVPSRLKDCKEFKQLDENLNVSTTQDETALETVQ